MQVQNPLMTENQNISNKFYFQNAIHLQLRSPMKNSQRITWTPCHLSTFCPTTYNVSRWQSDLARLQSGHGAWTQHRAKRCRSWAVRLLREPTGTTYSPFPPEKKSRVAFDSSTQRSFLAAQKIAEIWKLLHHALRPCLRFFFLLFSKLNLQWDHQEYTII